MNSRREYQKKYYNDNKERIKERHRKYSIKYYYENKEKLNEYNRKRYHENKEKIKERLKKNRGSKGKKEPNKIMTLDDIKSLADELNEKGVIDRYKKKKFS